MKEPNTIIHDIKLKKRREPLSLETKNFIKTIIISVLVTGIVAFIIGAFYQQVNEASITSIIQSIKK